VEYRQEALAKAQTAEQLSSPVRLTRPQTWIVLFAVCLVVLGGCVWAVAGSLPRTVTAPGILTYGLGAYSVRSPALGQISEVLVTRGTDIVAGAPVMKLFDSGQTIVIRAAARGRVVEVLATLGQYVTVGARLATVERVDATNDRLLAVLYVPVESAVPIRTGAAVDLSVNAVSRAAFGVLRGTVTSVGELPQTTDAIGQFLGDDQLADQFTAHGAPLIVEVDLIVLPDAVSGLAWSIGKGPPHRIEPRSLVTGSVRVPPVRPVDWLLGNAV
jgi:multidrug efflux pump subunit AcrA (membrane-fusion protein)